MKKKLIKQILSTILLCALLLCLLSCGNSEEQKNNNVEISFESSSSSSQIQSENLYPEQKDIANDEDFMEIEIVIGDSSFAAKLQNNNTTKEFIKLFPLTIAMQDLNNNEKFYYLDTPLPSQSYKPNRIKTGDIMLYGDDCLVIFYKDFISSYSYTKIGEISEITQLEKAIGTGSVEVLFSYE